MEQDPSKEVTTPCLVNKYSHFMGPGCSTPSILKSIIVLCCAVEVNGQRITTFSGLMTEVSSTIRRHSFQTGSEDTQRPSQ